MLVCRFHARGHPSRFLWRCQNHRHTVRCLYVIEKSRIFRWPGNAPKCCRACSAVCHARTLGSPELFYSMPVPGRVRNSVDHGVGIFVGSTVTISCLYITEWSPAYAQCWRQPRRRRGTMSFSRQPSYHYSHSSCYLSNSTRVS